jgi:hypothetical protein
LDFDSQHAILWNESMRGLKIIEKSFYLLLGILGLMIISSCSTREPESYISFTPLNLADGWPISSPEEQGVSSVALTKAFEKASKWPFMYSTLVVKNYQTAQ